MADGPKVITITLEVTYEGDDKLHFTGRATYNEGLLLLLQLPPVPRLIKYCLDRASKDLTNIEGTPA